MLRESDIIPYHCSTPVGEKILVLAPHPDDEALGCGGTISLLVKAGKPVKIVFLTSGDKGDESHPMSAVTHGEKHITDYSLMREKEAERALGILDVSDYEFLRLPDRELHTHRENALDRLLDIASSYAPDALYSPSPIEVNPDHRTTAALSLGIQKRKKAAGFQLSLLFYEVTVPLRPNILVDISPVQIRKRRAVKKYKSQLKQKDYLGIITALNRFRSLTLDKVSDVEAFWFLKEPVDDDEMAQWLSYRTVW
ncbi:MAG: PIG-L deacetylase family protein [Nitrospirota bacterium]